MILYPYKKRKKERDLSFLLSLYLVYPPQRPLQLREKIANTDVSSTCEELKAFQSCSVRRRGLLTTQFYRQKIKRRLLLYSYCTPFLYCITCCPYIKRISRYVCMYNINICVSIPGWTLIDSGRLSDNARGLLHNDWNGIHLLHHWNWIRS